MRILLIIICLTAALQANAATFYSRHLRMIAERIHLTVPSGIAADTSFLSVTTYRGHQIRVCTNGFGDVSHVGYKIFNDDLLHADGNRVVLHFIERYLLEIDLALDNRTPSQRMDIDKVKLTKGNYQMLRAVNAEKPFAVRELSRRMYEIEWIVNKRHVALNIPADCQLFLGANAAELEKMFVRDIQRVSTTVAPLGDVKGKMSKSNADLRVVDGGRYLSEAIRGDLYFVEIHGKTELVCSRKMASRSISNIMLTGRFRNVIPLKLKVDRYGYKADTMTISVQQFVNFCKQERCKLFFGIKTLKDGVLTGTVFALNEKMAYNHVLSVEFPVDILSGKGGEVKATLYGYIPLQNVTEKFFTQSLKEQYVYEK